MAQAMEQSAPIHQAVKKGDLNAVKALIARGADINQRDNGSESTPLVLAAEYGHHQIIRELVNAGVNINQADRLFGHTALMFAAMRGDKGLIGFLLKSGAIINQKSTEGWTALIHAAEAGNDLAVEQLLQAGAYLYAQTNYGNTALTQAGEYKHLSCCRVMVSRLIRVPTQVQKNKIEALLCCLRRKLVEQQYAPSANVMWQILKPFLVYFIEQDNRENRKQSRAWKEIARMKDNETKKQLIAMYWPQVKNDTLCSIL